MSLAELRKELKGLRKDYVRPISKMKKADCAAEIARMKTIHKGEEKKVAEVLAKADVPEKVAKVVKKVQETAHGKAEGKVKGKKEEAKKDDMKEKMARLRAMRKAKKEDE